MTTFAHGTCAGELGPDNLRGSLGTPAQPVYRVDQGGAPRPDDAALHSVLAGSHEQPVGIIPADNAALRSRAASHEQPVGIIPPPVPPSEWEVEFGSRVWFSSGKVEKDLRDPVPILGQLLASRLTYSNLGGTSGEMF